MYRFDWKRCHNGNFGAKRQSFKLERHDRYISYGLPESAEHVLMLSGLQLNLIQDKDTYCGGFLRCLQKYRRKEGGRT